MARSVFWHDGVVNEVRIYGPSRRRLGSVELRLSLYPTDQSPRRINRVLVCSRVTNVEVIGDMVELQDNAGAGNIEDGEIKRSKGKTELTLRLLGGRLQVTAARIGFKREESEGGKG